MPSSTTTTELQLINVLPAHPAPAARQLRGSKEIQRHNGVQDELPPSDGSRLLGELGGSEPSAAPVVRAAEKWNEPRRNSWRLGSAFWCFLVMGANDSAYGVSF